MLPLPVQRAEKKLQIAAACLQWKDFPADLLHFKVVQAKVSIEDGRMFSFLHQGWGRS